MANSGEISYIISQISILSCNMVSMIYIFPPPRNYEEALKILQRATVMPSRKVDYHDDTETVQMRLYKSLKIWSLYADLEESFGTFKVTT